MSLNIYCPICVSAEYVTFQEQIDGEIFVTCTGPVHGPDPYTWQHTPDPLRRRTLKTRSIRPRLDRSAVSSGWVVLPRGESPLDHIGRWLTPGVMAERELDPERLEVCSMLEPHEVVIGAPRSDDPDDLYVVFVYKRVIIAESPLVGNAAFALEAQPRKEWTRELSRPKSEVRAGRIIHGTRGIWKLQLKTLVDHGPPLETLVYSNGVPFDFEEKRHSYERLGAFVLPEDHVL